MKNTRRTDLLHIASSDRNELTMKDYRIDPVVYPDTTEGPEHSPVTLKPEAKKMITEKLLTQIAREVYSRAAIEIMRRTRKMIMSWAAQGVKIKRHGRMCGECAFRKGTDANEDPDYHRASGRLFSIQQAVILLSHRGNKRCSGASLRWVSTRQRTVR
jgi:hypothetical protein